MVDASAFAFVADGKNGLRVVQVLSPEDVAEFLRFQPAPHSQADRQRIARPGPRWPFPRASTATAPWMRAATSSPSSAAAARGPSIAKKPRAFTCAMASLTQFPTIRRPLRALSREAQKPRPAPRRPEIRTKRKRCRKVTDEATAVNSRVARLNRLVQRRTGYRSGPHNTSGLRLQRVWSVSNRSVAPLLRQASILV